MNTRSAIELITETLQAKQTFANNLEQLCEKYDIKDNIFCCDKGGALQEPDHGYFGSVKTYDTLFEAMKDFNVFQQGIRIHDGLYTVGNLYAKLSDVQESHIIDLKDSKVL